MPEQSIDYRQHRIYVQWRGRWWAVRYVRVVSWWAAHGKHEEETVGIKMGGRWPNKELAIGMAKARIDMDLDGDGGPQRKLSRDAVRRAKRELLLADRRWQQRTAAASTGGPA